MPLAGFELAVMGADDWPAVREIYAEGIATGNATFETEAPSFERWDATHLAEHRLVARLGDAIVGWAALAPVSERCVYRGVAENSVYVAAHARGLGIGYRLLHALVIAGEDHGIWTIQTGVFPENTASLVLHERCGFRVVGRRERLGQLQGVWRDVISSSGAAASSSVGRCAAGDASSSGCYEAALIAPTGGLACCAPSAPASSATASGTRR